MTFRLARWLGLALLTIFVTACDGRAAGAPTRPVNLSTPTLPPTYRATDRPTATPALTGTATPTPLPTATTTLTPTPDPYAGLSIDDLRARTYGGNSITILDTLAVTDAFTRSLIAYPSEGLTIYGFMNTPRGLGPAKRPVVIVNHGYINPANYQTLTYMTRYTDPLARAGFIVIHPNYRGYGDSDDGPNLFRVGYALDVLNLIALVKEMPNVEPEAIGLFGHSMGGGISLRVATVTTDVQAVWLYGSMSGDENANFAKIAEWRGDPALPELSVPAAVVARIAPIHYLANIEAAISLHHGEADATVPPEWSADLYARLTGLNKIVEYFAYPGQPHTFVDDGHTLLIQRAIAFFDKHLRGP